jgi:hypothetical protein
MDHTPTMISCAAGLPSRSVAPLIGMPLAREIVAAGGHGTAAASFTASAARDVRRKPHRGRCGDPVARERPQHLPKALAIANRRRQKSTHSGRTECRPLNAAGASAGKPGGRAEKALILEKRASSQGQIAPAHRTALFEHEPACICRGRHISHFVLIRVIGRSGFQIWLRHYCRPKTCGARK